MKFRIITTLVLLVVLGLAYLIFQDNQVQQQQPSQDDGLVLH